MTKYNQMVEGYDWSDGVHILGYSELMKRNKELAETPGKMHQCAINSSIDEVTEEYSIGML